MSIDSLYSGIKRDIETAFETATKLRTLGWKDTYGLSQHLFVTLYPTVPFGSDIVLPLDMQGTAVRALLTSDNDEIDTEWNSVFESDEGVNKPFANLLKSGILEDVTGASWLKGYTFVNQLQTLQLFEGVEAQEKTLTLQFVAKKNARFEVEAPFNFLKKMASPQLKKGIKYDLAQDAMQLFNGGGEDSDKQTIELDTANENKGFIKGLAGLEPFECVLMEGNKRYPKNFVITSVSSDRDKIKVDRHGNTIYREVSISLKSKDSLNRSDISI